MKSLQDYILEDYETVKPGSWCEQVLNIIGMDIDQDKREVKVKVDNEACYISVSKPIDRLCLLKGNGDEFFRVAIEKRSKTYQTIKLIGPKSEEKEMKFAADIYGVGYEICDDPKAVEDVVKKSKISNYGC